MRVRAHNAASVEVVLQTLRCHVLVFSVFLMFLSTLFIPVTTQARGASIGAPNQPLSPIPKVLWSNGTLGHAELWALDQNGNPVPGSSKFYDGSPGRQSVSYDRHLSGTHLLWTHTDGRASIWTLNRWDERGTYTIHRPGAGWKASSYQADPNNGWNSYVHRFYLLWAHTDGRASLWFLDANGNRVASNDPNDRDLFDCGVDFEATSYKRLSDGTARLLCTHVSGWASLWTLDGDGKKVAERFYYGGGPDWEASGYEPLKGGSAHLLWTRQHTTRTPIGTTIEGEAKIYVLDAAGNQQFSRGPYYIHGDWIAQSYKAQ